MSWEALSKDAKISQLIDALTLTAVGVVEQVKAKQYATVRARLTDKVDIMRLDVDFWFPLLGELRKTNKIPSAESIRMKAEGMVNMSDVAIRKALTDYRKEIQQS
ncbi:MAG: hypothetical protein ACOZAO_03715 [Patescibacteria group bacterium]